MTFAVADEDDQKDVFKEFGFDESGEEINIGILGEKDKKYPMEPMDEYDADAVREFLASFKSGMLYNIYCKKKIELFIKDECTG